MTTVTLEEALGNLLGLIDGLAPGDEIIITRNDQKVARLVGEQSAPARREPGNCEGMLTIHSEDDDLTDFADYLP